MEILGICGSLRQASYNMALLREAQSRLSLHPRASLHIFDRLSEIPPYNPDHVTVHDAVRELRVKVRTSQTVLVVSPQYAHGVPGVLKNALDWLVLSGEWRQKPTAIVNVSHTHHEPVFVRDGLQETLRVLSENHLLHDACFTVTEAAQIFSRHGSIIAPDVSAKLDACLDILLNHRIEPL